MIFYLFSVIVFTLGFVLGQKSTRTFHWKVLNQIDRQINTVRQDYRDFLRDVKNNQNELS